MVERDTNIVKAQIQIEIVNTWHIYGLTVVTLFLKMFATILVQVYGRFRSTSFDNPEDSAIVTKIFGKQNIDSIDDDLPRRAQNILRNDGENIPIFLFLALTYVQLDCWETGASIYFSLFVLTRMIHTVAYIRAIQPLRNLVFLIGIGVKFILSGHIISRILIN